MPNSTDFVEGPAVRRGVIDQFEGDLAVIIVGDDEQIIVPRSTLPDDARPGDSVVIHAPPAVTINAAGLTEGPAQDSPPAESIEVDEAETTARQTRVRDLLDDIFNQ